MRNHFIIADLHLGHANMAKHRGMTLAEHDSLLIENIRGLGLKPDDHLILAGDIFWLEVLPKSELTKAPVTLVLGNHDNKHKQYAKLGYKTRAMREYTINGKSIIITHIPVHPLMLQRWKVNVHGHTHHETITCEDCTDGCNFITRPDSRYRCVSSEQINFEPVNLEDII